MHLCDLLEAYKESFLRYKAKRCSKLLEEKEQADQEADAAKTLVPLPEKRSESQQSPAQDVDWRRHLQVPESSEKGPAAVGGLHRQNQKAKDQKTLRPDSVLQQDLWQSVHSSQGESSDQAEEETRDEETWGAWSRLSDLNIFRDAVLDKAESQQF